MMMQKSPLSSIGTYFLNFFQSDKNMRIIMTDMYQYNHLTKRVDKSRESIDSKTVGIKYKIHGIPTSTERKN